MYLRLVIDMTQLWIFHDEFLSKDAFGQMWFFWMMSSVQFFWWVIQQDRVSLCLKYFWETKKVYLGCILSLICFIIRNIGLNYMRFKVSFSLLRCWDQIKFLAYLGLIRNDKSDISLSRIFISNSYYFWVIIIYLGQFYK